MITMGTNVQFLRPTVFSTIGKQDVPCLEMITTLNVTDNIHMTSWSTHAAGCTQRQRVRQTLQRNRIKNIQVSNSRHKVTKLDSLDSDICICNVAGNTRAEMINSSTVDPVSDVLQ